MKDYAIKQGGEKCYLAKSWKTWKALIDFKTCLICRTYNGKIYEIDDIHIFPKPPVHNNCRCEIELLQAMAAGTATNKGIQGCLLYTSG